MQKSSIFCTAGLLVILLAGLSACNKKVTGLDNGMIVETPYSLYFSDTAGSLYNSIDGKSIHKVVFKADGAPCRAICTAHENILWAKGNLYISTNNGVNFNEAYDSLGAYAGNACNGLPIDLNQSMIVDIPAWDEVFTVTDSSKQGSTDYLGVTFSLYQNGIRGSWWTDLADTIHEIGFYGATPYNITMTSFAYLPNGTLAGYDARANRNFYRTQTTLWAECTAVPDSFDAQGSNFGNPSNRSGIPLPHHDLPYKTSRDLTARYSYGHFNNRLIAIDNINCNFNGAYYSDDIGRTWTQYPAGLPSKPLLCVASPFEQVCLIGTDSAGLWIYDANIGTFKQNVNGLPNNLIVRNIAAKENIYKNGKHERYVYLATNKGIYQSVDGGYNWVLTIKGNYVAVY